MRVGAFAKTSSSRISSGASYYGAMEMTGNLWEITVTSANIQGRNFSGLHGDGVLTFDGDQNVSNWPNYSTGLGSGMRGGGWGYQNPDLQVSDRSEATVVNGSRGSYFGGRGVRSVQ